MLPFSEFDTVAKKLFSVLPASLKALEQETEQKFKEVLYAVFARMDLVTREEFDIQTKVLTRAREKVEDLQQQVTALYQLLKEKEKSKSRAKNNGKDANL